MDSTLRSTTRARHMFGSRVQKRDLHAKEKRDKRREDKTYLILSGKEEKKSTNTGRAFAADRRREDARHLVSCHLPCSALSVCGPSAMAITTHPGGGGARSGGDGGGLPVASTSSSVPEA